MKTVAFIANQFPSPVEPYIGDQVRELRARGVHVICCSVRRPVRGLRPELEEFARETLYLYPLRLGAVVQAIGKMMSGYGSLKDYLWRIAAEGAETPARRTRAMLHTGLGAYLAVLLKDREVEHIHVHHGYFGAWIAMVAARLLGIPFSITLHGSDVLLHRAYMDTKLENCQTCFTVSDYNHRFVEGHYGEVVAEKLFVQRMGVTIPALPPGHRDGTGCVFRMLSVGRLHPVKNHAFLLRACQRLKERGVALHCVLAGDGPERSRLERLIEELHLTSEVEMPGQMESVQLDGLYEAADVVVLTSRSEGIPLILMEAMARGCIVLAPKINGIPELVIPGATGFLYQAGSLEDFLLKIETIRQATCELGPLRAAARQRVIDHYNHRRNLESFTELFLSRTASLREVASENSLLQQI